MPASNELKRENSRNTSHIDTDIVQEEKMRKSIVKGTLVALIYFDTVLGLSANFETANTLALCQSKTTLP